MDARKIAQKQSSGNAVKSILCPTNGIRDEIRKKGGVPKNHARENYIRIKLKEQAYKEKKMIESIPKPQPFKLKQFSNISSKISTRRTSPNESRITSGITTPKNSAAKAAELNMMDELQERFNQLNLLKNHSTEYSKNKNFIRENKINAQKKIPQKNTKKEIPELNRKTKIGEVPQYLINRKLKWKEEQRKIIEKEQQGYIPDDMMVLPEEDRLETLEYLNKNKKSILDEIRKFPITSETLRIKNRKKELTDKIEEIDKAIEMFSQKRVLVMKEDFETMKNN
ncbi:hypothetical protein BCR32DRAFT_271498 [Anaeromyces robustus]|uniref:Enkurin domain-containing protein n=1 Tax=Anaeromyces robustus TaxID=1754192 RepID=A0A1Y1WS18_9FUNG|nr:hypothetical protein BCR32DRAFT_271498 [Anaeromyces robustus]|eukprot:ORX76056.1 hypothetical protein BCR32DRAFT_271498 [Anaeromyces robustus]